MNPFYLFILESHEIEAKKSHFFLQDMSLDTAPPPLYLSQAPNIYLCPIVPWLY